MSNNYFSLTILLFLSLQISIPAVAQEGETVFKTYCSACHKISSKRLVGPGLANIHERRSEEWFDKFVKSSQSLIKSGDAEAIQIFEEFGKMPMPDQALSEGELDAVWAYIQSKSPVATKKDVVKQEEEPEAPFEPTQAEVSKGESLFVGKHKFKERGPTCNSCHQVQRAKLISGGSLGVELSDVYSRLGKEGIEAVITGLPFPAMKKAYKNHAVTEEEAYLLTAFLKDVNDQHIYDNSLSFRNVMVVWGIIGAFLLMGIYPLLWYKRKKESVNKRIYERQIKSNN